MHFLPRLRQVPLAAALGWFLAGGLIGIVVAPDRWLSLPWLAALVGGALTYAAITVWADTTARLRLAAMPIVLYAVWSAIVLAVQYRHLGFDEKFAPATLLGQLSSAPFPALIPPIIDRNAVATTIEGALPLALALALRGRGRERFGWIGCSLVIAFGLFLTASRGAFTALAIGAILYTLLEWRRRRPHRRVAHGRRLRWVLLAGGLLLLAGGLLLRMPESTIAASAALERATDRLVLYRNSFFLALDFAYTGSGSAASFPLTYSAFQLLIGVPFLGYPHNLLLGIWLAQGLVGLLGFGALLWHAARLIWRGLMAHCDDGAQELRQGAAVGSAMLLIHGISDAPQYDAVRFHILLICFAIFGVAIAGARLADARPLAWIQPTRQQQLALLVGLLLMVAGNAPSLAAHAAVNASLVADAHAIITRRDSADQNAPPSAAALAWAEHAARLAPQDAGVLKRRGLLAYRSGDYTAAIAALEPAFAQRPADEAIRKALGYAYTWNGQIPEGVVMFAGLERVDEVRQELSDWARYWGRQQRWMLQMRARVTARALAAHPQQAE